MWLRDLEKLHERTTITTVAHQQASAVDALYRQTLLPQCVLELQQEAA